MWREEVDLALGLELELDLDLDLDVEFKFEVEEEFVVARWRPMWRGLLYGFEVKEAWAPMKGFGFVKKIFGG